jgi:PAS domain S-box-containing protein
LGVTVCYWGGGEQREVVSVALRAAGIELQDCARGAWRQELAERRPIVAVLGAHAPQSVRDELKAAAAPAPALFLSLGGAGSNGDLVVPEGSDGASVATMVRALMRAAAAEEELRLERERGDGGSDHAKGMLAAIVESSDDAIVSKTLKGIITSWNAGAERLLGYSAQEAIGKHISLIIPRDRFAEEDDILARIARGERIEHFETIRRRKDGRNIAISLTISPLRNSAGTIIGASKIARDITERRQRDRDLRASAARERARATELEAVMYSTPAIVFMAHDPECDVVTGNRAAYGLLRLPEGANTSLSGPLPDRPVHFRTFRSGIELAPMQLPLRRAALGEEVYDEEVEIVFDNGMKATIYGHAVPLREEDGKVRGAVAAFVDVTELKKTREELSRRVADLARSNAELQDFAYLASHDLKEPLRGISSYAEFLLEDYGPQLGEQGRLKLEAMVRLPKRMYSLLDSLLEYSRLGRVVQEFTTVDLASVAAASVDSLSVWLAEQNAQVVIGAGLPQVRGNSDLLGQVFSNLITNGVKYNLRDRKVVEIGGLPDGTVFVRDNGIGIPERHREAIFRMFRRLHGRDAFGGGTGAGLAIVKKIIDLHGGRIWVEAPQELGSTFLLRIPPPLAPIRGEPKSGLGGNLGGGDPWGGPDGTVASG